MSEPAPNTRDPNAPLSNSLAAWMLQNQPELALKPTETFAAARELAAKLVSEDGFDGRQRFESVQTLPGGVPVFGQGGRSSSLSNEDWNKVYEAIAPSIGLPGQGRNNPSEAQSTPPANGNQASPAEVTPPTSSATNPVQVPGSATQGETAQPPANVATPNPQQLDPNRPQPVTIGGTTVTLDETFGDFRVGLRPNAQAPGNVDAFGRFTNPDSTGFVQSAQATLTGTPDPLAIKSAELGANFRLSDTTTLASTLGYDFTNSDLTARLSGAYQSRDQRVQFNGEADFSSRTGYEVLGNGRIQFDPNTVGTGDFRFANNGVNTVGLGLERPDLNFNLRGNSNVDNGQNELIGNGRIQFDPNTVGTGDFRFANNGVNTVGLGLERPDLNFNLRGNSNVDNGQNELIGNGRIQFDPNTVGTGDFRFANNGVNTVGLGLERPDLNFNLRGNSNVDNGQNELIGNGRIQFDPNTVGTGDFRIGNFGVNTLGVGLDSQRLDFNLRGNRNVENGQSEMLGNGSLQLNAAERLSGDFRVGNFGADRFGITFNRGDAANGFDLGVVGTTRDGATPGQLNLRGEYRVSEGERLNYAINGQIGTESQLGGRLTYNPNDEFRLQAGAAYNFATNVGTGSFEAAYKPKDRDLSIFAGASVNTQGESSAAIGLRWNFRDTGGNPGNAGGNDLRLPEQSSIDSAVVTHRISQLQGRDRELYDQAFDQVNRLNAGGANLPQPAASLGLAAFADEKGITIGDARLVTGQDGKQTVWVGNASLDNPSTQPFGVGRDQLANTEPNQALNQLASNNWQNQAPTPQNQTVQPQRELEALEQQRVGMGGR